MYLSTLFLIDFQSIIIKLVIGNRYLYDSIHLHLSVNYFRIVFCAVFCDLHAFNVLEFPWVRFMLFAMFFDCEYRTLVIKGASGVRSNNLFTFLGSQLQRIPNIIFHFENKITFSNTYRFHGHVLLMNYLIKVTSKKD